MHVLLITLFFFVCLPWLIYPACLCFLARFAKIEKVRGESIRKLSIVIAAHNEEDVIVERLGNILDCDIAGLPVEIIVVSDNSDDRTCELVEAFAVSNKAVKLLESKAPPGRANAHNYSISHCTGDVVVFTDSETIFEEGSLRKIISEFNENKDVGYCSGALKWLESNSDHKQGISLYWKYEMLIRSWMSKCGILATGTGAFCAVRRHLYKALPAYSDVDCGTPIDVVRQGFIVSHCADAIAYDRPAADMKGEFHARARMTSKNMQSTLTHCFRELDGNTFPRPTVLFAIVVHKIFRWFTPIFGLLILLLGLTLILKGAYTLVTGTITLLVVSILFLGFIGLAFPGVSFARSVGIFLIANAGFFVGILAVLRGKVVQSY